MHQHSSLGSVLRGRFAQLFRSGLAHAYFGAMAMVTHAADLLAYASIFARRNLGSSVSAS